MADERKKYTVTIDLKQLKEIYATYGAMTLDEALRRVSNSLMAKIRTDLELDQTAPVKLLVE